MRPGILLVGNFVAENQTLVEIPGKWLKSNRGPDHLSTCVITEIKFTVALINQIILPNMHLMVFCHTLCSSPPDFK